ncbi:demethoxyubiquinone hydroxylase family protein [Pyruvatibacter mobilis]|uniref:demethoxyubiquinone hydroxylase family protein n=1 Tax=Pyruvatibacter mobilis TaxID=1712261 RepID=UPI003BA9CEEA
MTASASKTATAKTMSSADLAGNAVIKRRLHEMIRVDHAGESGAVRIYEGQLAVFRAAKPRAKIVQDLEHMAEDEEVHLDAFNKVVTEEGVRPTLMNPVWGAAGFAMGAVTALMGEKAAHACTAAVEEVIDEHYQAQVRELDQEGAEPELRDMVEKFRLEEIEHKEKAIAEGAEETPGYPVLSGAIKAACRLAIRVSEKI